MWLSEINLGIGREEGTYQGIKREWLYWYDEKGERYLTPEEQIAAIQQQLQGTQNRALQAEEQLQQERQRAESERVRSQRLEELLRSHGIDPNC